MADNDPNKLFRAKLGQKPTLRFLLSKKDEPAPRVHPLNEITNRRRHLGTIQARRPPDDIFPRRRQQGLILNFWDLGFYYDSFFDEWFDLDWFNFPTLAVNGGGVPIQATEYTVDLAMWDEMKDAVFSIDVADWDTLYMKVEMPPDPENDQWKPASFGIDVYSGPIDGAERDMDLWDGVGHANDRYKLYEFSTLISGTKWQDGVGYVFDAPQSNISVFTGSGFAGFGKVYDPDLDTDIGINFKITGNTQPEGAENGNSYTDPEVSFTWSGNVDVFLMPVPMWVFGNEIDISDANYRSWFGMYWMVQSRKMWLEMRDVYDYWDANVGPAPETGVFSFNWQGVDMNSTSIESTAHDGYALVHPDVRYLVSTDAGTTATEVDPDEFPQRVDSGDSTNIGQLGHIVPLYGPTGKGVIPEGALLAVLRKNGQLYFVWASETKELADQNYLVKGWSNVSSW